MELRPQVRRSSSPGLPGHEAAQSHPVRPHVPSSASLRSQSAASIGHQMNKEDRHLGVTPAVEWPRAFRSFQPQRPSTKTSYALCAFQFLTHRIRVIMVITCSSGALLCTPRRHLRQHTGLSGSEHRRANVRVSVLTWYLYPEGLSACPERGEGLHIFLQECVTRSPLPEVSLLRNPVCSRLTCHSL